MRVKYFARDKKTGSGGSSSTTSYYANSTTGGVVDFAYNAEAAQRLRNPRKIWGQTFDGTADVNGDLTIKDGNINVSGNAVIKQNATVQNQLQVFGDSTLHDTVPQQTNTYNLGTADLQWKQLFANDATFKNLTVTGLATFFELVIDKIKSAGGAVLITPADGFTIDIVEKVYDEDGTTVTGYKLYWRALDENGNQRDNMWKTNDQCVCMSFNQAKVGVSHDVHNKYYWSLVTNTNSAADTVKVETEKTIYYTWIRYADDSEGTGISSSAKDKSYIGFAYNQTSSTPSSDASDYSWSPISANNIAGVFDEDYDTYSYTWVKYSRYATGLDESGTSDLHDSPNWESWSSQITAGTSGDTIGAGIKYSLDGENVLTAGDDGVTIEAGLTYFIITTVYASYIAIALAKDSASETSDPADYQWASLTETPALVVPDDVVDDTTQYNYIVISATDYDGTLEPEVGDEIAMLGYRGTDDTARQSAIYISAYSSLDSGLTAPLIAQYRGIDDYDLASHRSSYFDAAGATFVGNVTLGGGTDLDETIENMKKTYYWFRLWDGLADTGKIYDASDLSYWYSLPSSDGTPYITHASPLLYTQWYIFPYCRVDWRFNYQPYVFTSTEYTTAEIPDAEIPLTLLYYYGEDSNFDSHYTTNQFGTEANASIEVTAQCTGSPRLFKSSTYREILHDVFYLSNTYKDSLNNKTKTLPGDFWDLHGLMPAWFKSDRSSMLLITRCEVDQSTLLEFSYNVKSWYSSGKIPDDIINVITNRKTISDTEYYAYSYMFMYNRGGRESMVTYDYRFHTLSLSSLNDTKIIPGYIRLNKLKWIFDENRWRLYEELKDESHLPIHVYYINLSTSENNVFYSLPCVCFRDSISDDNKSDNINTYWVQYSGSELYTDYTKETILECEDYSKKYELTVYKSGSIDIYNKTYIVADYQVSDLGTEIPTGTWVTDMPEKQDGKYLWTRTYQKMTKNNDNYAPVYTYSVSYWSVDADVEINGMMATKEILKANLNASLTVTADFVYYVTDNGVVKGSDDLSNYTMTLSLEGTMETSLIDKESLSAYKDLSFTGPNEDGTFTFYQEALIDRFYTDWACSITGATIKLYKDSVLVSEKFVSIQVESGALFTVDTSLKEISGICTDASTRSSQALQTANSFDQRIIDLSTGLETAGIHINGVDSSITLKANKTTFVNKDGATTFSVDSSGNLVGSGNATLKGKINATGGNFKSETNGAAAALTIDCDNKLILFEGRDRLYNGDYSSSITSEVIPFFKVSTDDCASETDTAGNTTTTYYSRIDMQTNLYAYNGTKIPYTLKIFPLQGIACEWKDMSGNEHFVLFGPGGLVLNVDSMPTSSSMCIRGLVYRDGDTLKVCTSSSSSAKSGVLELDWGDDSTDTTSDS